MGSNEFAGYVAVAFSALATGWIAAKEDCASGTNARVQQEFAVQARRAK